MKLKTSTILALMVGAASLFTACNKNEEALKKAIEETNQKCPFEVTRQFTMQGMKDDGQFVEYRYVYADSLYNPRANVEAYGEAAVKQTTMKSLFNTPVSRPFFLSLAKADRGLRFTYIGAPSGDSSAIVIPAVEIVNFADSAMAAEKAN